MSYSSYCAGLLGNNTYNSSVDGLLGNYTSPYGLTFTQALSGGNTWTLTCTQGANGTGTPSFTTWGFSTLPDFSGFLESAVQPINNPIWRWNYLPLGTYVLFTTINEVGSPFIFASVTCGYANKTTPVGFSNYTTSTNSNNTMNIQYSVNGNIPNAYGYFVIYKIG